jgi:hypothetical protein
MEDKLMDNHDTEYTLLVGKKRIPVTQEVYKAYYRCRDREKYLDKLAEENNISLEGCAEKGISVEYIIATTEDSMEDAIILNEMIARMLRCVKMLDGPDRKLIVELYHKGKPEWNKHMVKRILENRRYLGTDKYPAIISKETYLLAGNIRGEKNRPATEPASVKTMRKSAVCAICGSGLKRHTKKIVKEKWYCEGDGCDFSPQITDALLIGQATDLLNLAIQNPAIIEIPPIELRPRDIEVTRLANEINRELDKTDCDEEYVKILIMARAAAQYGICPDGLLPKMARELRAMFESRELSAEFDAELFEYAVDAVIVQPDGTVSLKLKNGQYLNKSERRTPPC